MTTGPEQWTDQSAARTILDAVADGLVIFDANWRFTYLNAVAEKIVGKASAELIGKIIWEVFPDLLGTVLAREYRRAIEQNVIVQFEVFYPPLNRWFEVKAAPQAVGGLAATFRDISSRKRTEEALRSSERFSRTILESSRDCIEIIDLNGTILYLNDFGLRTFCLRNLANEVGQNWIQFWEREYQLEAQKAVASAAASGSAGFTALRVINQQPRWWDVLVTPIFDAHGKVENLLAVSREITDRRKADNLVLLSEERFRLATQYKEITLYEQDADLRYTWLYPQHLEHPGSLGKTDEELLPDDTGRSLMRWKREVMQTGQNQRREVIVRFPGKVNVYDTFISAKRDQDGKIIGVAGTALDVTERKTTASALKESETRFRTLADHISQLAWMADETGYAFWYNKRWFEYTGTSLEEMKGLGWQKVHHPDHVQRVADKYKSWITRGEPWEDTFPLRQKDGSYRWFLSRAIPIRNDVGNITRWFGTNTDITEWKEAREELARSNELLESKVNERTSQLRETIAELEAFSYSISHDMRAPLRTLRGFAEILMSDFGEKIGEEGMLFLRRIISASDRMDRLIQDVLSFSKISRDSVALEPVDLAALLSGILETYPNLSALGTHIRLQGNFPKVLGNAAALTQCLSNLLGNAVKFVTPGVTPEISVWAEPQEKMVTIYIRDNGIGIPQEVQKRIFDIFYHHGGVYEGTGIGLAIVKKAVERIGGSIAVHSEPEKGSTFMLKVRRFVSEKK